MNQANPYPAALTLPQPHRAVPAPSQHEDSSPDPRELTPGELLAVAGGPTIKNGSA